MTAPVTCPSCGAQTQGKFCSECGQPLAGRACVKCGASLSARAKFCPECGTTVAAGARGVAASTTGGPSPAALTASGIGEKFPWIIAGLAVLALLATIIVVVTRRDPAQPAANADATFDPNRGTTDLTSMTPREAADRLYERTARAAASGDTGQVAFFGPMTLQAYANVTPLDADARLHLGLVQLNLGNPAAAVAQADTIARSSATHLFVFALRAQAATQRADAAAARTAYQAFLRNYDSEIQKNLPEYQQHQALLDEMRAAAQSGGSPRS
jgi:hypothetical protein